MRALSLSLSPVQKGYSRCVSTFPCLLRGTQQERTYIILRRRFPHKVIAHNRQLLHDVYPDLGDLIEELEDEGAGYDAEEGGGRCTANQECQYGSCSSLSVTTADSCQSIFSSSD